jgi:hypothetical protein
MQEGKMLGHVISKEGVKIDPSRVETIQKIDNPRNKKEVQSFLGRVNFLRRFIPNFVETVMFITHMLRKENHVKWADEEKGSFDDIKREMTEALVVSPYYSKGFMVFYFFSEHTIAGVLLQKNDQNLEQPIIFYSKSLRDSKLNYNIMDKKAYALVKALKEFRVYILHSHVIVFVPNSAVKDILT